MIEQLVSRVFTARDITHREHLRSRSYAQHVALGDFYTAVIEQIDSLVESYQGQFGLLGDYQVETTPVVNITTWLLAEMDWIEVNRTDLANGSTSIENQIDGLLETYQRTIYKLTYLA